MVVTAIMANMVVVELLYLIGPGPGPGGVVVLLVVLVRVVKN